MVLYSFRRVVSAGAVVLWFWCMPQVMRAENPQTATAIIGKALAHSQRATADLPQAGFTYTKVSVTEELDGAGKVREHKEKVYQVSFRAGASSARLLEVNGHAPGQADVKRQAQNELNLHQLLGESKPSSRDSRESFLTPDVAARFDFALGGEATLNGRRNYLIEFTPQLFQ